MKEKKSLVKVVVLVLSSLYFLLSVNVAYSKEISSNITGDIYVFDDKHDYPISETTSTDTTETDKPMGQLVLSGDFRDDGIVDKTHSLSVSSGNIAFSYMFDSTILNAQNTEWHIIEDKIKKIDSINLKENILKGAIVVQTSNDGEKWVTDKQLFNVFKDESTLNDPIYQTQNIQLENGCFYRIIVAYKMQIKTGENTIAFVTTDTTEQKRIAEVYEFYAVNPKSKDSAASSDDIPRKELASKPISTGVDNGFSGNEKIDKNDPHFGWELGTFIINGYTRETMYNNKPIYLKNVGDKVTLWFKLNQDINKLNDNDALSISEDSNGYDQVFGVKQTNFGHGTVIIEFTDHEGKTHDPVIYTNFLEANAHTGADTRVQLFEEGDYEVTLDYEIKNDPRKLGPVSVVPTYTNYKISFGFSIRNGNCMFYPFDITSGNELSDNAITTEGFKLDMAKSRYLNIDVTRTTLKSNSDGLLNEDIRFNRPAKDNDSYSDEGIYKFTVTNLYTGATTTKTLYVGTDKYLKALSKNNIKLEDLNSRISEGFTVEEDGSLTAPIIETEADNSSQPDESESALEITDSAEESTPNTGNSMDTEPSESNIVESIDEDPAKTPSTEKPENNSNPVIYIIPILCVGVAIAIYVKKKKSVKNEDDKK
ncbi:hypothetical protein SAMN05216349_11460 [Oribacterium sp. KHPX15]|uniref:hypothetical protein n=1 Tax=Oribacterium sp. KHPX15 TaxID=1855342 RepID=UPI00089D28C8|nr:hypothetical protein [Oribacterium sp. KHPX15]SEA49691.1 hypothetical protein SAMN05216349_11460 [Oribacterium sp. KHPX15]